MTSIDGTPEPAKSYRFSFIIRELERQTNIKSSLLLSFEPLTFRHNLSSLSKVFYLSGHRCHYHLNQYRQHTPEVQQLPEVMPEVQPEVKPKILHHRLRGFIQI